VRNEAQVHSFVPANKVRALAMDAKDVAAMVAKAGPRGDFDLARIGVHVERNFVEGFMRSVQDQFGSIGMDDTQGLVTTASTGAAVQFLQTWLPGNVEVITAARQISELIGEATVGNWHDEEVVQRVLERVGSAALYGDRANTPLATYNWNNERRTVIRFEQSMFLGKLEELRSAAAMINAAAENRAACASSIAISQNMVGFYGFNGGANRTYGFLNDPSLPAYVTAAATGTSGATFWSTKTATNIVADIRGMLARLQAASRNTINIRTDALTLAVAPSAQAYLSTPEAAGNNMTAYKWLAENYPNITVKSAPELDAANGGANVAYLYADKVRDSGTDGGATFIQIVPSKFVMLGSSKDAKGYTETYSSATAGVMVKRPYAIQRLTGI